MLFNYLSGVPRFTEINKQQRKDDHFELLLFRLHYFHTEGPVIIRISNVAKKFFIFRF